MAGDENIPNAQSLPVGPSEYGEYQGFATDSWRDYHERLRSWRDLFLSYVLFPFVLTINIVWDYWVIHWVNLSGSNASFHLSDTVLIALATTSVANFIGLVSIVAKHLYPEVKEAAK